MNPKPTIQQWMFFLITGCIYSFIFFWLERTQFGYFITFACTLFLIYTLISFSKVKKDFRFWMFTGIVIRLLSLFYIPNLSDDIYRFIWDGNLLLKGINPFEMVPDQIMQSRSELGMSEELYQNMNSRQYHTVYPPISQFIFWFSALIAGQTVWLNSLIMKLFIFAAEVGSIYYLRKLLIHRSMSEYWSLLYFLNPLIILELTGNLHFEGIMIFFLLASMYMLLKERYWVAFFAFAFAVNTKMIPLILVPYLSFSLGWRRTIQFGLVGITTTVLLHLPFLSESFIKNIGSSLGLYFKTFEFNASIYYLVRWIGFQIKGYNIIATAGPYLATISTLLIIAISWFSRNKKLANIATAFILILTTYFLFSTTVHPWYITTMVAFMPLTGLLFPVIWSASILLTYSTYKTANYDQNVTLIGLEYVLVMLTMYFDFKNRKQSGTCTE